MPDTVTFTRDWYMFLASLRTHAARWTVLDAVCRYAFDGSEPLSETFDTDDEKRVFMSIKKEIKERNRKRNYITNRRHKASTVASTVDGDKFELEMEETSNSDVQFRRSKASNLDGHPLSSNQHIDTFKPPLVVQKNYYPSPKGEEKKKFVPPTLEEVREYCQYRRNAVDPEEFHAYYSANNWMVGHGNKMRDWKSAIRYWERSMYNRRKKLSQLRDYSGI